MTLLNDGLRIRAAEEMSARISDALSIPPPVELSDDYSPTSTRWRHQSISKGAAGVALLHGIRAQDGCGSTDRIHAWLQRATSEDLSAGPGAGLWFGVPAVAFAIMVGAPGRYRRVMANLDAAVSQLVQTRLESAEARMAARARPALSEFDLVRGLTGLGAHLLSRDPQGDLIRRVLTYLVRLTEPVAADDEAGRSAPGWWTSDAPSGQPARRFGGGHANFGMAHGIAGPLTLLALAMRHGVTVDGHAGAIGRICDWLDNWRHEGPAGPWWPEHISRAELRTGRSVHDGPGRPSWCYGTPGLARAQQLAGLALCDLSRQRAAEDALARCLADHAQLRRINDPTLCHGWAGLLATTCCVATDAGSPDISSHLRFLTDELINHADDLTATEMPGLIDGSAGTALALHSIADGATRDWQRCLLLN